MNDRAIPTPPPHPDVWYGPNDFAPGSGPDFAVWMCTSSNGYRTVLWIQKTLPNGQVFSAFDYICDGQIGVPWLGANTFVALHGTQTGAGNWPDVVFLYGVNSYTSASGDLDIIFPDEEYAKGYRTAIYMGNDQTIVYPPNSSPQSGRRYCYDALWTQGDSVACDPLHISRAIYPRPQFGPIVFYNPGTRRSTDERS
jgi:hypothetical protein